jgi:hypothetical protein
MQTTATGQAANRRLNADVPRVDGKEMLLTTVGDDL